jgi:hypothetical protein
MKSIWIFGGRCSVFDLKKRFNLSNPLICLQTSKQPVDGWKILNIQIMDGYPTIWINFFWKYK